MGSDLRRALDKLGKLFSRYPQEPAVRPDVFEAVERAAQTGRPPDVLAFQSVADKFYFLVFGAIRDRLSATRPVRTELVIVRAVSGAVGTGIMAELKRAAPVAWLWTGSWVRAYGRLIDGVAYRCASWCHPVTDVLDWFKAKPLWRQMQLQGERPTLKIRGVEVADLLIDSYLRFKPSAQFDPRDPFVRRLIWQALRDVRQASEYFERVRPRWYLTSYATYMEHGIPVRAALHAGVAVWAFGSLNYFGKRLSLADSYHPRNFSTYRSGFDRLANQAACLEAARVQLETRLSGGIDAATSYMRRSAYAEAQAGLPPGLQGAVVIFLHDFYDSPHVYPDLIFDDFWRWVCFTIDALKQTGARFFLKPHPNQIALSDAVLARLRIAYPDIQWLADGASNVALARAGIACGVTVYGTVAHELAFLGVPSITCARHPHHTFDFCRTARTQEEYREMLHSYQRMSLDTEALQQQALAFYYMHNLHGSDAARELQQTYVALWRACNVGDMAEDEILDRFRALTALPAFHQFVDAMAAHEMAPDSLERCA